MNLEKIYNKNDLNEEIINQEIDLVDELGEYLNDIIDEINKELKNINQNRKNNWRKLKNPKILQKYLNLETNIYGNINLEINKLNNSNYQEIIKSLTEIIDKNSKLSNESNITTKDTGENKDILNAIENTSQTNANVTQDTIEYIFYTIIQRY